MSIEREHRMVLELANRTSSPLRVWMEPWAEELLLAPGVIWQIVCNAPKVQPMAVELHDDSIAVHGVSQSTVSVLCGDELVWKCFAPLP